MPLKGQLKLWGPKHEDPIPGHKMVGVVVDRKVECTECFDQEWAEHVTLDPKSKRVYSPIFNSAEWGFTPTCHKCGNYLHVPLIGPPKFALREGTPVVFTADPQRPELAEIVKWVTGEGKENYVYLVQCTEDGTRELWHQEDFTTNIDSVRWK